MWENAFSLIEKALDKGDFDKWFKDHVSLAHYERTNAVLYLRVDHDMVKAKIQFKYKELVEAAVTEAFGTALEIRYLLPNDSMPEIRKTPSVSPPDEIISNPRYTFENFITGDNSRFAVGAAMAVAQSPGKVYSPLFIYGDSGLGKTHLMNAIGIYVLEHFPKLKVLYVSSEMFTEEFVTATQHKKMNVFKGKYRNVDVLLIDDIQFISGKEKTVEEVFNTYNALYNSGKQMVFTSDKMPKEMLGVDERLIGRLAEGLLVDITPPDPETRRAILKSKASLYGITMDDGLSEVISFIADNIKTNVRELESAFNRVVAYAKIMEEPFSKAFAKRHLSDIIGTSKEISGKDIKKVVAAHFNLSVSSLDSEDRSRALSVPRQISMYLCRELTDLSFNKIADLFKKDYATVHYAYDKIKKEITTNENLNRIIITLTERIQDNY